MLCQHNSPEKAIKVSDCIHTFSRHVLTLHPRDNTIAELDCARRTFVEYVSLLTLPGLVISFVADLSVTKMIVSVLTAACSRWYCAVSECCFSDEVYFHFMQGIEALPGRLSPVCAQREEKGCLGISGVEIEEADLIEWRGMDTSLTITQLYCSIIHELVVPVEYLRH